MLLADGVRYTNSVGPSGIATIIASIIVGYFSLRAAKLSKKTNDKVGNGWTEELGRTLEKIQESADRAALEAAAAKVRAASSDEKIDKNNDSIDKITDGVGKVNISLANLTGQFEQHIRNHKWRRREQ